MKKLILTTLLATGFNLVSHAQHYNIDGTPDKRYKENKIYKTPNYNQNIKQKTYNVPNQNYTQPKQQNYGTPLKKNGTPDMRYKQNKYPYSK